MKSPLFFRCILETLLFTDSSQISYEETRFGPEIELHGLGHKTIHLCIKGSVFYMIGVLAYPAWARLNKEDISPLHLLGAGGIGFGCYAAFMLDSQFSAAHLRAIANKIQPRVDASELQSMSNLTSKLLKSKPYVPKKMQKT